VDYLGAVVTHAVQQRRLRLPRVGAFAATPTGALTLFALLLAVSALVRTRALGATFWIDEGLSVGIGSFPLGEISGVLRQDGSPPLYYVLLHGWMRLVGSGETETHALSLLFALLAIPAALWAGWSIFGRRAGWIAAVFAALNPFLTVYAQETRMYSLLILLSILATAAFVHAFVFRRRRYVPAFALVLALMLYTHNWALFFVVGALAALAVTLRESDHRRGLLVDGALGFGGAALAFAPWIPTLVYQAFHTGAPWSTAPSPLKLIAGFTLVLSGEGAVVALLLAGGGGLLSLIRDGGPCERTAVLATIALAAGTLLSGWLYSQLAPAWAGRYLGVLIGPVLLLVAAGIPRAGRLGIAAGVLVVLFWAGFLADDTKSNVSDVAARFQSEVRPGDLILSTQPEQIPVLAYYFGRDHRYATPLGPVTETRVMDWRNALARLEGASVERELEPLLAGLPEGGRVFLVRPLIRSDAGWKAEWTAEVRRRSYEWGRALAQDERFVRTAHAVPPYTAHVPRGVRVDLFTKTTNG
jgi:mannosyltransferase